MPAMKCDLDRNLFLGELDFLAPVLKDRPVQPPTLAMSIADGRLTMASYDGRISLCTSVAVNNAQPGEACVRGGLVRSMAKLLPKGSMGLDVIKGDRLQMTWPCGEASFPHVGRWLLRPITAIPSIDLTVPTAALGEMLASVAFAIDEASYSNRIPGTLLEVDADGTLRIAATDGYSLAVTERPNATPPGAAASLVMPSSSVSVIRSMLAGATARMLVAGDDFQVTCGARTMTMRAAVGKFPAYQAIIPKVSGACATMHAADLTATVQRVLLGGDDEFGQVNLAFTTDSLQVSSADSSESLSCLYGGAPYAVRFDAKKLRALLAGFKADRISLFTDNHKYPQLFQPAGNARTRMVLAPINKAAA